MTLHTKLQLETIMINVNNTLMCDVASLIKTLMRLRFNVYMLLMYIGLLDKIQDM